MTRPFIPFPIFPPYVHWRPNQLRSFPTNLAVADRLAQIDPAAHPFINIWYVDRYVNWIAHNWGAENPHRQYYNCIMGLEKMLNWSFAHGLSLVDWRRNDFENYAEFVLNPPKAWTVYGQQARFVQEPGVAFEGWSINPIWRPFLDSRSIGDDGEIEKNVWKREIRCATQFLDFYLKDTSASRENVAAQPLADLAFKQPKAIGFLTDAELEWVLKSLPNFLGMHEFRIIEMYLIMARYSGRRLWSVMGTARSPSHLDQFNRRSDGRWVELRSAKDGWLPLTPHFDKVFDRYLSYLNIDPLHPLPSIPIFPKDDRSSYNPKALGRILVSIRDALADSAAGSDDPEISSASEKIRGLTVMLVSRKPVSE